MKKISKVLKVCCLTILVGAFCCMLLSSPVLIKTSALSEEPTIQNGVVEQIEEDSSTIPAPEEDQNSPSTDDAQVPTDLPSTNQPSSPSLSAEHHVIVFGGGKISAVPDVAYVSIGVESLKDDLQLAVKESNDIIIKLIDYLKEQGISSQDIKTKNYSIYQRHDYSASDRFLGYQVSNTIEFKTKDLENLGEYVSKLTSLGANRLGGITFDCENISSYYQEALKLAIEDATNKAEALTGVSNLEIDKITEECVYTCMPYRAADTFLSENATVMAGKLEIEAKIRVEFKKI